MGYITLKGLDFRKMRNWIVSSKDKQSNDPVFSFISAWIGFNYYYSTFTIEHREEFISWTQKNNLNRRADKSQWLFLVNHNEFKAFFKSLRENNAKIFEVDIHLPVKDLLHKVLVPKDIKGEKKFRDLDDKQIFSIIYQIRNNLFHGVKDPKKDKRDRKLSSIASDFMVPLLTDLIENTEGEVKNIF